MTSTIIVLSLMAAAVLFAAYRQGKHLESLKEAKILLLTVLPLLLCAFVVVGFMNVLIPKETLLSWLGAESGWKGLLIGPAIGALIQGGPYAFFPLFGALFKDSISIGAAIAMITAWGMINIGHLPYEFTFLGSRFVILKNALYLAVPTLIGLLANILFG